MSDNMKTKTDKYKTDKPNMGAEQLDERQLNKVDN